MGERNLSKLGAIQNKRKRNEFLFCIAYYPPVFQVFYVTFVTC